MVNNNSDKKFYTYGKYTLGGGNFIKKFTSKNSNTYSDKIISKFKLWHGKIYAESHYKINLLN